MNRELIHNWFESYKVGLYRFAFSILKDETLAEDALQEVFLRILTGKYWPQPGKERAYLYRCIRNICYDELRKKKHFQDGQNEPADTADPYAYLELIASLSPQEQQIVTLKIVGGLTNREIGMIMGISEQAAKKRYQRAIEKLREG